MDSDNHSFFSGSGGKMRPDGKVGYPTPSAGPIFVFFVDFPVSAIDNTGKHCLDREHEGRLVPGPRSGMHLE